MEVACMYLQEINRCKKPTLPSCLRVFFAKYLKYKDLSFSLHEKEVLNVSHTWLLFAAEEGGSLKALPKCMFAP